MFDDESSAIAPECTIVVDIGYSYTHVVPIRAGEVIWEHVKRSVPSSASTVVPSMGLAGRR